MSLSRILTAYLFCLALTACGFHPIYSSDFDSNIVSELQAIKINPIKTHEGQILTSELDSLLNPHGSHTDTKYNLLINLGIDKVGLAIQKDTTVTRYKVTVSSNYTLKDAATSKIISQGRVTREGGYDKAVSEYATFVSENKAVERVLKEMAQEYKSRLMAVLIK